MLPVRGGGFQHSRKLVFFRQKGWQAFFMLLIFGLLMHFKERRRTLQAVNDLAFNFKRDLANIGTQMGEMTQSVVLLDQELKKKLPKGARQDASCRLLPPPEALSRLQQKHRHKIAVILPSHQGMDLPQDFISTLSKFLKGQGREFSIFVIRQSARFRFNRGMLLNAGVSMLALSDYDYFVFHDTDLTPTEMGMVPYDYPYGDRPLHLTPPGLHPVVQDEKEFEGVMAFTLDQLDKVNGFGNQFWGWPGEMPNMQQRLVQAGMWPPKKPNVAKKAARYYWRHSLHLKPPEVVWEIASNGTRTVFEKDRPNEKLSIDSDSQLALLDDLDFGLHEVRFWVKDISPLQDLATIIQLELHCEVNLTPWCVDPKVLS